MNPGLIAIGLVMLAAASLAVSRRAAVPAALWLAVTWLGLAAFYLWTGDEFLAFAQVLVYGGAVSMLVLFAVALTRREPGVKPETARPRLGGLFAAGVLAGALTWVAATFRLEGFVGESEKTGLALRELGRILAERYAVELVATGALLTASLLGAVLIVAGPGGSEGEGR